MIICPICNAQLEDTANFCHVCGTQFIVDEPDTAAQQNNQQQAYPQQNYAPNTYAQQGYPQQPQPQQNFQQGYQQPAPAQPKKKKGVVIGIVAAVLVVLAAIGVFAEKLFQSQGYGSGAPSIFPSAQTIDGEDVFQGEHFDEMLWGYYELENYKYTGSFEDSAEFRTDMKYLTITDEYGETNISVLPISLQMGCQAHFIGSFLYEDEYYEPYTEQGKAMFRKAYMAQHGDLSEEDFQKLEDLFNLMVAEVTLVQENGAIVLLNLAYKIDGNTLSFYEASVDEQYNVTIQDKPLLQYTFLHDGGKLILACNGLQRNYFTGGYKETDSGLYFSGYALNDSQQYGDLEGFFFSRSDFGGEISIYPTLTRGETPVDATMDLDVTTGKFTLKWTKRWVEVDGYHNEKDDPTTITGTIIPCTSYGFTDYSGFIMIVDGKQYKYLMSETEYEERQNAALAESENLSDSQKEDLANTKRNILEELEKAFQAAGISAEVDYDSGKIALEANFLFDTSSYELSQEGQAYLDKFVDAYASVVLREDYTDCISRIVVEGHTDTKGSYSMNQTLSQNRADAVAQRCISRNPQMENIVQAVGCAYDYPIYNDDGTVNMEKSRRVNFRFVLTDG